MAKNSPDERIVYLAFKDIFVGPDAELRSAKKIRTLVQKHFNSRDQDVRRLVDAYNIDVVVNTVKSLLQEGIFSSTLRAKIRFPEVFEVSPVQSAEREVAESEAARSDEDAIRDAVEGMLESKVTTQVQNLDQPHQGKSKAIEQNAKSEDPRPKPKRPLPHVASLYPVYLPHASQHKLFTKVQALLETACYAFASEVLPELIEKERWDCPEDVELNKWARIFRENEDRFDANKLAELGKPFPDLLSSIAEIRHTAVHRLQISANTILRFLRDAESLAYLLTEPQPAQQICSLRRETQQLIEELGRHKDLLETVLRDKMHDIDRRRRELDKLEQDAVEEMFKADREYQTFVSLSFGVTLSAPATVRRQSLSSGNDTLSEEDNESDDTLVFRISQAGESSKSVLGL